MKGCEPEPAALFRFRGGKRQFYQGGHAPVYIANGDHPADPRAGRTRGGAKLFDRNSRPVALTPAGKVFLKEAREILGRMDVALSRIREASTGLEGELRLGYTKGYEHSDLPKYLRIFHQDIPTSCCCATAATRICWPPGCSTGNTTSSSPGTAPTSARRRRSGCATSSACPCAWRCMPTTRSPRRRQLSRKDLKQENILFMSPSGTAIPSVTPSI